ncbi:MAG: hypothetical protein PHQ86_09805 [Dehalococcoidales bacterium]|nr:hypothetical protein [Dehalococcoidales bacterium]
MDITKLIFATCGFAISVILGLVGYIWVRADKKLDNTVSKEECKDSHKQMCDTFKHHEHDREGNVRITYDDK